MLTNNRSPVPPETAEKGAFRPAQGWPNGAEPRGRALRLRNPAVLFACDFMVLTATARDLP